MEDNREQYKVITHKEGPAVVLSGAGSGKTHTLTERIKKLVSDGVEPNRIVAVTFTNAAAEEMKKRAAQIDDKCKNIVAQTYHKYCSTLLRKYGRAIGIEPSMQVLETDAYTTFIDFVKSSHAEKYEDLKDFPSPSKLQSIFSTMLNTGASIRSLIYRKKYQDYALQIEELFKEVKEAGMQNQKFSFDDLLVYTDRLLSIDNICEKIAKSFDYLMVDEFQDTNDLQLAILLKLSKYNDNIVIVGDISQSIYKFRGANVENINNFIDAFPNGDIYSLSVNYRSTQEILDAANSIMNTNPISWPYVDMKSYNDRHGSLPKIVIHGNDYAQAYWIIELIKKEVHEKNYGYNQIAIIERSSLSSFLLESELNKAKIAYDKKGGRKFNNYKCVTDMVAFLSVMIHKANQYNWFDVLKRVPKIGAKTATKIAAEYKETDFLSKYKKKSYYAELELLRNTLDEGFLLKGNPVAAIRLIAKYYFDLRLRVIDNSNSKEDVKFDQREAVEKDKEIIEVFINMASNYDKVSDFLNDLALDSIHTKDEDEDEKVVITTIHSAKGLEFPVVILLDCIEPENGIDDFEEELRCLYVAITRAEDELYVSIPRMMNKNGKQIYPNLLEYFDKSLDKFEKIRA